jgi:glutathione S-transferase
MRQNLQMNCELRLPLPVLDVATRRDVARVCELWAGCARFADPAAGPYLFGAFSAADAYFSPVVRRFVTYEVAIPDAARRYVDVMEALPAMKAWMADALAEHDFYVPDEPYRERPAK